MIASDTGRPGRIHWPVILLFAILKLLIHLYCSGSYHYFRDELYYIVCGRRLDWGYVDHPPLIALMARVGEMFGGLRGFRLPVTVAGALRIILTGVIAARLGGGRYAQALACAAVLLSSIYLAMDTILTMNTFEHLFWLGALLVVIEIARGGSQKLWLLFGAIAGVGLQNKHSMVFLGAALVVALLLTPMRRSFLQPWMWLGGLVALLLFLPNLIWQYAHGFPTLELLRNVKESDKNIVLAPLPFIGQQVMMLNPFTAPVWMAGLGALLLHPRLRPFRFLAWTYLAVLAIFIGLEAKDYYVAPIYPMLFAGGAVALELALRRPWARAVLLAVLVVGGLVPAPLVLPLLPPQKYLAYQRMLGAEPHRNEASHTAEMPQIFADQFGWEETVAQVARFYHSLPPEVRGQTAIFCSNYGGAGAIDFYGPRYGLPPAISGHQSYYLWGPRGFTGQSMIILTPRIVRTRHLYATLSVVGRRHHPYAIPEENGPIFYASTKRPLREIWPEYKMWR